MKNKIIAALITISITAFIFFSGLGAKILGDPNEVYQVYLEGEKIGLINSRDALYDLIDTEQSAIKDEYGVKKVYPPNGLDVKKIYTYNSDLIKTEDLYDKIKDIEPFTIQGYTVTIKYTEDKIGNNEDIIEQAGTEKKLYMLDKDLITKALYDTAAVFIGGDALKAYNEGTQVEITDTGEKITSVYFKETITIKEDLISAEEYIFRDSDELARYLLYGTLEDQKTYIVQDGDNLDSIADDNNLNIDELLIANPQFNSANELLTVGDKVNVGLINPLVSVTYRKNVVVDQEVQFKTEYVDDNTKWADFRKTTSNGVNGINRLYQDITYVNGDISSVNITGKETIKEMVPEVITRGTKRYGGGNYNYVDVGNDTYSWPTVSPFMISSRFKWRWGKLHKGIDIAGCGEGSPIYAVKEGTVVSANYHSSMGNNVVIDHGNGVYTQYMHMTKYIVSKGQKVKKQQKIGYMGNTGYSKGTHLHLGVWLNGEPYHGGTVVDPCKSIFKC